MTQGLKTDKIGKIVLNYEFYSGTDEYSDGDAVENKILDIVKNQTGYEYVCDDYNIWAVMYHLSRQRENIAEPMLIGKEDSVLEVGAGMGAVTGAMARMAAQVDCIELSRRRSEINAWRHKNLDNIEIYVGNFQDIRLQKKYDVITLIGVLEYAQHYIKSEKPYEDFLKQLYGALKEGGRIYIAIENKLGMKYFAGYHEDHLGKAFAGIEGYKKEDMVATFSQSELNALLAGSGFTDVDYYYPFPDYKFPTVILCDENIKDADIEFSEYTNYDLPVTHLFNQNKAFESLKGTDERKLFSNSFLFEAWKR